MVLLVCFWLYSPLQLQAPGQPSKSNFPVRVLILNTVFITQKDSGMWPHSILPIHSWDLRNVSLAQCMSVRERSSSGIQWAHL